MEERRPTIGLATLFVGCVGFGLLLDDKIYLAP
jgi:hypothetical protein